MGAPRINHMELTFPQNSLTAELKSEISAFYGDLFGWTSLEVDIVGQKALLLMFDDAVSQFILCAESPKPLQCPGLDHLGLHFDSFEEVDELLARCKDLQKRDSRIQIKEYDDLVQGPTTTRAFYLRHLLPIWFDIQTIQYEAGSEPAMHWAYVPRTTS